MDKQYIISFQTTLKGNKLVVTGLKKMEGGMKKFKKTVDLTDKSTKGLSKGMMNIAKRALLTIPVWLVLRSVMMGLIRTVGKTIQAYKDLDEGMARIKTVIHGTTQDIEAGMIGIRRQILDMAVKTRVSIKNLAEAFYFLKTASLSTEEAMAAFEVTINAMVGTGVGAKEMARAIAGIYNTMGKHILEGASASEKMQKIADVLTYTYATQDVEMSELIAGYTKLAPYVSGLSDSFTDLVTMIGFLNTRMLRAGRTGRLTGRTILQITKNADKLRDIFGIVFDPDQPIGLIDTISQINDKLKTGKKLTFEQQQALQTVFATRGAVSPRLLLESFDGLTESLILANKEAEGFAKKMSEIRMRTIAAQTERFHNILAVLVNDFVSGVYGTGDLASALESLNDTLEAGRDYAQGFGDMIGYFVHHLSLLALVAAEFQKGGDWWDWLIPPVAVTRRLKNMGKALEEINKMRLKTYTPYEWVLKSEEERAKARAKSLEDAKEEAKLKDEEAKQENIILNQTKKEQEILKHNTNLLKIMGASRLDMAKYQLKYLENLYGETDQQDELFKLEKARNKVIEERLGYRREMVDVLQQAEIDMLKARGATEWEILNAKERQYVADKKIVELARLKVDRAVAIQRAKEKELQTVLGIYVQIAKGNEEEKERLKLFLKFREMSAERLGVIYRAAERGWPMERPELVKSVLLDFIRQFGRAQQMAIIGAIAKTEGLADPKKLAERWVETTEGVFSPKIADPFWDNMFNRLGDFKIEWNRLWTDPVRLPEPTFLPPSMRPEVMRATAQVEPNRQQKMWKVADNIIVNVDTAAFEKLPENIVEEIKKRIMKKQPWRDFFWKESAKGHE